ncbi:hypothetical protein LAJ19_19665 (plasmid) [Deinococcus taeanensis]|uniref:hypothetical protein n=1 Tax=Deinococcus taeanensis TaxID=2737050 RepID=UPI001CDCE7D0|nr:hypothetical protein [Deinococcus taeanensis]UBV45356.1 hypothetical protein LAJ19_19665 [Deinococcus taeanensis]
MCRYALTPYKTHYACFSCRKTFKAPSRRANGATKICPQCGVTMTIMGHDFKAPHRTDLLAWQKAEYLAAHGLVFGSCGCSGPGYAPQTMDEARTLVDSHLGIPEGVRLLRQFTLRHPR